jgi:hypothetical protein
MALELSKVTAHIEALGQELASRAEQQRRALPAARALLREFGAERDMLRELARSAAGQRLRCASPGGEFLDRPYAASLLPENFTLIATDGSQIYPDRHGVALYYVINIGSIVFRHGSGQAPEIATDPEIYFRPEDLLLAGQPVADEWIEAKRDLAEMRARTSLALAEPAAGCPTLALADGPLLAWFQRPAIPPEEQNRLLDEYLGSLDQLAAGRVAVAGFVSRPRSAEVVALLYLAHLPPEERPQAPGLEQTTFGGLADRQLFGMLEAGQRSALFVRGTAANADFAARGHEIYFFYLQTGADVARVEVPQWVALDPALLDLVQAAVYDQCRFNNGYPFVLTCADEQAVILGEEREILQAMIMRAMARRGLPWPELSRKAQQKQVARWRRRGHG